MSRPKKETESLFKLQKDLLTSAFNKKSIVDWGNRIIERCCDYYKDLVSFKEGETKYISFPLFCGKVCVFWTVDLKEAKLYYYDLTKGKNILWKQTPKKTFLFGLGLLIGFTVKTASLADQRTKRRLASLLGILRSQLEALEKPYPIELSFEREALGILLRKEEDV